MAVRRSAPARPPQTPTGSRAASARGGAATEGRGAAGKCNPLQQAALSPPRPAVVGSVRHDLALSPAEEVAGAAGGPRAPKAGVTRERVAWCQKVHQSMTLGFASGTGVVPCKGVSS